MIDQNQKPNWEIPLVDPSGALDEFISEASAEEKQDYSETYDELGISDEEEQDISSEESSSESSSESSEDSSGGPSANAIEIQRKMVSQALVGISELGTSYWCSHRSLEGDPDKWKFKASDRKTLEDELNKLLIATNSTMNVPVWMNLAICSGAIIGGSFLKAEKIRKINLQKRTTEKAWEDVPPEKKNEKVEFFDSDGNPAKDYWTIEGKDNPISDELNKSRAKEGGEICLNCGVNYCNEGKEYCSQHCSGKGRGLNNKKTA